MAELAPSVNDVDVMARAKTEQRILLTEDKDFGDLIFRRGYSVPGIVLLRINPALHSPKRLRLDAAVDRFGDGLFGRYVIIEGARIRTRPLPKIGLSP